MFLVHTATEHAEIVARAVVGACRGSGWHTPVQPRLLNTLFNRLLGSELNFETLPGATLEEVAACLSSAEERAELIELMCAIEILCDEVPDDMANSVEAWARELRVDDRSLAYLRDLADKATARSVQDFYRLNWIGDLQRREPEFDALFERYGSNAYAQTVEADPERAKRWQSLEGCPAASIGRAVFEFYDARGFLFPGQPGAASEAVAHHDWIHVLADYGTTPLGEIEVVSFQTACSRAPGAMLGLIGALALFESGAMPAGLVTGAFPHQGLSLDGGIDRMAEAILRGRACNTDLLLEVDFFTLADEALPALRSRFAIPPRSGETKALDPDGARGATTRRHPIP